MLYLYKKTLWQLYTNIVCIYTVLCFLFLLVIFNLQKGFTVNLGHILGIHLDRFHCFAHQLDLIVKNTAKAKLKNPARRKFKSVHLKEKDSSGHSSFHTKSSKNHAHLRDVMVAAGMRPVRPPKVMPVRWASSYKNVLRKEYIHAPIWWEHYARISSSDSFSKKQRDKADYLKDAIVDKDARLLTAFLLDVLTLFGKVSEEFQKMGKMTK